MTGAGWDASEMCWRHKPEHYGAIHFHEDDIYDFGWQTDFTLTVSEDMPSGVYVMHIEGDHGSDALPFYICPPKGTRRADLCVLIPTFTYVVYGNHARPDYDPAWQGRMRDGGPIRITRRNTPTMASRPTTPIPTGRASATPRTGGLCSICGPGSSPSGRPPARAFGISRPTAT